MPCSVVRIRRSLILLCALALTLALALPAGRSQAQDPEFKKKMEEMNQRLINCQGDPQCLRNVSEESQRLINQQGLKIHREKTLGPTAGERIPVKIRIRNSTEFTQYSEDKNPNPEGQGKMVRYISRYYVFEYDAAETGVLHYLPDYKSFFISAPHDANQTPTGLTDFHVLRCSGYTQGWQRGLLSDRESLKKTTDGAFKGMDPGRKSFSFSYDFNLNQPPNKSQPKGNIFFTGIWALVHTDSGEYSYQGLDLNPARATNPPGQNYLITPDQIRQAVETGSITLTFHWGETFELGGRHDNQLTVTIEVEKQAPGEKSPGVLSVSPADDFQSSGPDAKGRFNPEKKTYTLANTGQGPLQFQAAPDHPWVTVSAPSGSIPPKGNRSVVIGIDAAKAQALPAGPKECPVQFKNLTNGQGTTNRKVKIGRWEKWRALWHGWETLYFGDETLAGGIKPIWEIQVDFEIEDGKYKQGQGTAKFVAFEPHSHPPGVYDCNPKKGEIIDGKGKKQPTPFIQHTQFNVSGSANSASAKLNLPSENLYLVDYECFMDTDQAKDKLGLKFGKLAAKDKVKESDNYKSIKNNGQPLPSGSQTVMLQDGWKKEFGETKSMDAYWILVRRLE